MSSHSTANSGMIATLAAAGTSPAADLLSTRPKSWDELVGQADAKAAIQQHCRAANLAGRVPGHVLLSGARGLGKTSAADLIAEECGLDLQRYSGTAIEKAKDIYSILAGLKENTALFVDETHRLPRACHDALLVALEDFRLDVLARGGRAAHSSSIQLPHFCFIAATTSSGQLAAPLRDRFALRCQFEFYSVAELADIIRKQSVKLGLVASADGIAEIAARSRGTARLALSNAAWVAGWQATRELGIIEPEDADAALTAKGVLMRGLDRRDVRILSVLAGHETLGLATLAATIEEEPDVVASEHEPWLLRCGAIVVTSRGRSISARGRALLEEMQTVAEA